MSRRAVGNGENAWVTEPSFDFDVALSFAGEDRAYVHAVAERLRENRVRVFYDEFMPVDTKLRRIRPTYPDEFPGHMPDWLDEWRERWDLLAAAVTSSTGAAVPS